MPTAFPTALAAGEWRRRAAAHAERADALTAGHRARRSRGERHAVEDFLYTYYDTRPAVLRRWHPGAGVALLPGDDGTPAPQAGTRWYATDARGAVALDTGAFLADRGDTVRFVARLLAATAGRPAFTGCFGLHEWAMVYRADERRHALPLRLGRAGTDAVVEAHPIRCSHYDAFRFFTPEAVGRNALQPTRATQVDHEQPGCLHAGMDLHKWSLKLGPAVPGELALDCFALAADVRVLDMEASPYDLSAHGRTPVRIETPEGRAEYARRQRALAERGARLRARLLDVCTAVLAGPPAARHTAGPGAAVSGSAGAGPDQLAAGEGSPSR
ncbi:3-methyladenine DNA glycosylase [Blastococcus sp. SYSU D00695]